MIDNEGKITDTYTANDNYSVSRSGLIGLHFCGARFRRANHGTLSRTRFLAVSDICRAIRGGGMFFLCADAILAAAERY
jgi:hypothetical protein